MIYLNKCWCSICAVLHQMAGGLKIAPSKKASRLTLVLSRSRWSPGPEGFACGPCIGSRRSYPNPRPATASSAASASGSSHGWFFSTSDRVVHKRKPGWWFIYGLYMVDIYIYVLYLYYIYIIIYIHILYNIYIYYIY